MASRSWFISVDPNLGGVLCLGLEDSPSSTTCFPGAGGGIPSCLESNGDFAEATVGVSALDLEPRAGAVQIMGPFSSSLAGCCSVPSSSSIEIESVSVALLLLFETIVAVFLSLESKLSLSLHELLLF
ncbi:hypothetical protein QQP08_026888 [Theobroma cacao]|nr:hypothetical protein QQP08_026888 [Theobroma cacao]